MTDAQFGWTIYFGLGIGLICGFCFGVIATLLLGVS